MSRCKGILSVTAVRSVCHVERSNTVSRFEFGDVGSDFVDVAGMIIASVCRDSEPGRVLANKIC